MCKLQTNAISVSNEKGPLIKFFNDVLTNDILPHFHVERTFPGTGRLIVVVSMSALIMKNKKIDSYSRYVVVFVIF